jgi:glycosyltransferase involved in cell wall biosynthesis
VRIKAKYKLNGDYLIAVGINPRKNSLRIIDAFRRLKNERNLTLVFVGRPFHIELPRLNKIRILGHVSEADMPILYSGARVLVYPSIYEGFGLPILEAFACQTPVVTSNLGSLKEVARDAAVLVNPKSTQSILEGIKEAFNNKDFLVRKGVKIVKTFSWKKTAEKTYNVYKENELIC